MRNNVTNQNEAAGTPPLPAKACGSDTPQFLNPFEKIQITQNRLPHWQQDGVTYFVTFRLADSIPADKLARWKSEREVWMRLHPPPWTAQVERDYLERFAHTTECWLDKGYGACLLRAGEPQRIVANALAHFEGQRHHSHAWVAMPNHIHALFSLIEGCQLETLIQSWKGFTAHEINRVTGRAGTLWERDYFDRLVRDSKHFWNCVRYIRRNPLKAKLQPGQYVLFESNFVLGVLNQQL
ncbi:MAG: transposase [Verrucomicrobia bacterium]|nr:transposase [Verrucomicrobiota bacterium]